MYYYFSRIILTTFVVSIILAILTILALFFLTKEIKAQNINFLNSDINQVKVIIGNNNEDGTFVTYSYEFND